MFGFFQGWQRKTGCLTLALALLATSAWLQSGNLEDNITFPLGKHTYVILSSRGQVTFWRLDGRDFLHRWRVQHHQQKREGWLWLDRNNILVLDPKDGWTVHYPMFVLPLALLSAFLILCKPRPRSISSDFSRVHSQTQFEMLVDSDLRSRS